MDDARDLPAFERSQIGALVRQVRHHLAEVDAALSRLDAGTYTVCEPCGEPIGPELLEALPAARLCIRCAARASLPDGAVTRHAG